MFENDRSDRPAKAFKRAGGLKSSLSRPFVRRSGKGIGPNKASGHKGGIGRQGSKRG